MQTTDTTPPAADAIGRQPQDRNALARVEWNGLRPHKLFAELSASPDIGDALVALGAVLMDEMDHRSRGLVALRASAVSNSTYAWPGQVAILLGQGVFTPSEIARVAIGPTVFTGHDAAVLWAVDHVLAKRPLDVTTRDRLGKRAVLEITIATHLYAAIGSVMRGVEPEPEVPGIEGLRTPAEARGTYIERSA